MKFYELLIWKMKIACTWNIVKFLASDKAYYVPNCSKFLFLTSVFERVVVILKKSLPRLEPSFPDTQSTKVDYSIRKLMGKTKTNDLLKDNSSLKVKVIYPKCYECWKCYAFFDWSLFLKESWKYLFWCLEMAGFPNGIIDFGSLCLDSSQEL